MRKFIFFARAAKAAFDAKSSRKWATRTMLCNICYQSGAVV